MLVLYTSDTKMHYVSYSDIKLGSTVQLLLDNRYVSGLRPIGITRQKRISQQDNVRRPLVSHIYCVTSP